MSTSYGSKTYNREFEDVRISPDEQEARRAAAVKFHNLLSTEGVARSWPWLANAATANIHLHY